MAATQYQILYRYVNPSTGSPLVNDTANEYVETFEFYTFDHKLTIGSSAEQIEEEERKMAIMADGNSANNVKNDMLFVYGGTKKILHKKYIGNEEYTDVTTPPYVIKDYYIRVPMSPWVMGSRYASLTAALEKATKLVEMIGIQNVKLLKVVPYDVKIKIV